MQELTTQQRRAIGMSGRICCLIAGAGSGKTHTLTERIIQDTATQMPETMVVVTFTNAAANEIRDRISKRGLDPERFRHIGTLHAWATRETRLHRRKPITIASERQIKEIAKGLEKMIGPVIRSMSGAEIWRNTVNPPMFGRGRTVGQAMRIRLEAANLTHHDLILADFAAMIEASQVTPPARIYVDEYQDSAPVDAAIYQGLQRFGTALYVIGDPRQAIYGFRGAEPKNLTDAWHLTPDGSREILTVNFRSSAEICSLATRIASRMDGLEFPVTMEASTSEPGTVTRYIAQSEPEEMLQAAKWIQQRADEGMSAAVLCRYNAQAKAAAMIIRAAGIRTTCSADGPTGPQRETLEDSMAKIQTAVLATYPVAGRMDEKAAKAWWLEIMTSLAVPMANQDALLPSLLDCQTREDVISLGATPEPPAGRIAVATIHAAKGLEWDAVWFLGADSAAFPEQDQESGRMVYVATTRARRHLVTSHAATRAQPESGKNLHGLNLTAWIPA